MILFLGRWNSSSHDLVFTFYNFIKFWRQLVLSTLISHLALMCHTFDRWHLCDAFIPPKYLFYFFAKTHLHEGQGTRCVSEFGGISKGISLSISTCDNVFRFDMFGNLFLSCAQGLLSATIDCILILRICFSPTIDTCVQLFQTTTGHNLHWIQIDAPFRGERL